MNALAAALIASMNLGASPDAGTLHERLVQSGLFVQRTEPPYDAAKGFATMLDESSRRVVNLAKRVEIIRLAGESYNASFTATAKPGEPNVAGFAVQRRFSTTDEALIARIKATVLSPTSYRLYEGTKFCGGFQPKVVFRFESFGDVVDVLLCFNCEDVGVGGPRQKAAQNRSYPLADMKTEAWWALAKEVSRTTASFSSSSVDTEPKRFRRLLVIRAAATARAVAGLGGCRRPPAHPENGHPGQARRPEAEETVRRSRTSARTPRALGSCVRLARREVERRSHR